MIRRFRIFLGPARTQALFLLLAITGLGNLILNALEGDWTTDAQTALVGVFVVGAIIIIGGRMDAFERGRWAAILFPVIVALFIGVFIAPNLLMVMLGLSAGWIFAGLFIFRARGPMQYQQAVKHLRKSNYADAVKSMDELIKDEPDVANHYRFRAEVLRVWGKVDRARRDYEKMTQLAPDSAVAFNGLAEVNLQSGRYEAAQEAALTAFELAPDEWVAAYNLGMIEDRLGDSEAAITHLNLALEKKVKDARHRLLIYFYLARAHARMGDAVAAVSTIELLKKQQNGLQEWHTILGSPQAATLRAVLQQDIDYAEQLIAGELDAAALAETSHE